MIFFIWNELNLNSFVIHSFILSLSVSLYLSLSLQSYLCAGEELAKESIRMLLYEPAKSPEGMLAKQAMHELRDLRAVKQQLEKSIKRHRPSK